VRIRNRKKNIEKKDKHMKRNKRKKVNDNKNGQDGVSTNTLQTVNL